MLNKGIMIRSASTGQGCHGEPLGATSGSTKPAKEIGTNPNKAAVVSSTEVGIRCPRADVVSSKGARFKCRRVAVARVNMVCGTGWRDALAKTTGGMEVVIMDNTTMRVHTPILYQMLNALDA